MVADAGSHLRLVPNTGGVNVDGRVPPHDLDAEVAVLSALMIDDSRLAVVSAFLRPAHFYSEAHRLIFEGIIATAAKDAGDMCHSDIVQVASWLKNRGRIASIGGVAYLTEILNFAPAVAHVEKYATTVHDKWRARMIIARAQEIAARGYIDYGEVQDFADSAAKAMLDMARQAVRPAEETNTETLQRIMTRLSAREEASENVSIGLMTGIGAFDRLTHGLRGGQKICIAAQRGAGKTAAGLQATLNVARAGIGVAFFECEMTRDEMFERLVCHVARVPSDRFRTRQFTADEWRRITAAHVELSELPIRIVESSWMTVEDMRARTLVEVERMRIDYGAPLGLVVVDYIQRIAVSPSKAHLKRHEQVAHATESLKKLAQELSIPVIELAQRKQVVDGKGNGRKIPKPIEGDVGESKRIEDESDVVIFLWEPNARTGPRRNVTMVMTKQRGGSTDERPLIFQADQYRFEDGPTYTPPAVREYVDQGGWTNNDFAWGAVQEER